MGGKIADVDGQRVDMSCKSDTFHVHHMSIVPKLSSRRLGKAPFQRRKDTFVSVV